MPNATGEHNGTALDTHWSYVLEAHIAWTASGANMSAIRGDAAKMEICYDMDAISGYTFVKGAQSPGGGAIRPKTGWVSWPVKNIRLGRSNKNNKIRDAIITALADVQTQVSGLCGSMTPQNVFFPRHPGAHSDVIYIDGNNIITFGAKHNVGNSASRQISMSDAAKSFLAHTNLPVATMLSSRYAAWITAASGAPKPPSYPTNPTRPSRSGPKPIASKHQNAMFDPRIFIHAFNQKGVLLSLIHI